MRNSSKWSIRTFALVFEYSREFKILKILKIFPALKRNKESKLYFNIKLENARRPSSSSFLQNKTIEEWKLIISYKNDKLWSKLIRNN